MAPASPNESIERCEGVIVPSHDDRRRLAEIEKRLYDDDPRLVHRFDAWAVPVTGDGWRSCLSRSQSSAHWRSAGPRSCYWDFFPSPPGSRCGTWRDPERAGAVPPPATPASRYDPGHITWKSR